MGLAASVAVVLFVATSFLHRRARNAAKAGRVPSALLDMPRRSTVIVGTASAFGLLLMLFAFVAPWIPGGVSKADPLEARKLGEMILFGTLGTVDLIESLRIRQYVRS